MPAINKKDKRLRLEFVANKDQSINAGLVAVEAMAQRFGLWKKIRAAEALDPRRDKRRGYGPEVIIGQLIYALCSGGGCLSDSEALNEDPLARELFGVGKFADQSQVGQWLREQTEQSQAALRGILREFVQWAWQEADPQLTGERHRLKGAKEQLFSEVLSGMDLHRPPCSALGANQIYYLIAALAYNLMVAIKVLDLGEDCQGWRLKTLIRKMVMLPGRLSQRSRQWVARVLVPGVWLCWWQRWAARVWPSQQVAGLASSTA